MLTEARRYCDTLVVGINSDESIKRLKGGARLYEPSALRRAKLLNYADVVIEFEEDTPLELIRLLRPSVLIRGDEGDEPLGSHLVSRVVLVPKLAGYSTTAIAGRVA